MDYKIENAELENNSITLAAGSERKLTLTLTSLNPIDSKYELYYLINGEKVNNPDIEIGYTDDSVDSVKGTISANATKEITVSIKNNSSEAVNIKFGCEGGLINNDLVMSKGNSLNQLIMGDDLVVAYTYIGEETEPERFPNKDEGYFIKSVTCNGMDAKWNNATWSLTFSNVTGKNITCNFEIDDAILATNYIMSLAETNTNELRIDKHAATGQQNFAVTEYRYYGATPNNYVWFNEELWRIIGVFDVDDGSAGNGGTGNVEKRVKIIRANPIGNYSYDSSASGVNVGHGVNEWNQADLMTLLNKGAYYNRTTGTCYNGQSNATTSCDFSENSTTPGLTTESKEMIGNAKWYLGAGVESYTSFTAADFYNNERGTNTGKQCSVGNYCNDSVERKISWTGQIGLMYPSDYGYSVNMTSCASTALASYNISCKDSSWLYNSVNYQWTLSPRPYSSCAYGVFNVNSNGSLSGSNASYVYAASPVTYLKSNIKIIDGIGTDTQPYILSK